MVMLLIVFAVCLAAVLCTKKKMEAGRTEKEEGGRAVDYDRAELLAAAFRDLSPNSRGRGSIDYLNLSTIIQKIEAGEEVPAGLGAFILSRIPDGEKWAEIARGAGA
jgi:hypothetical protein